VEAQAQEYGYSPLTTTGVLRLMTNLSRWMQARGMGAQDLSQGQARELAGP
jgi:hypothetical protein